MPARYLLRRSSQQYYWVLYAVNGEALLTSERYTTKAAAEGGIASARVNSPIDARYARLVSSANQPYFVLRGANGEPIGTSEMYSSVAARENGIAVTKRDGPSAPTVDQT